MHYDKMKVESMNEEFIVADAMDILVTGYVADAGAAILYKKKREELLKRFSESYLWKVVDRQAIENAQKEKLLPCLKADDVYINQLGASGIYKGLWDMTKAYNVGFRIVQKEIPIHQETIEICNFVDVNPYALFSEGNLLIVTKDSHTIMEKAAELNVPITKIGYTTKALKKVFIRGDEERFLERPKPDFIDTL